MAKKNFDVEAATQGMRNPADMFIDIPVKDQEATPQTTPASQAVSKAPQEKPAKETKSRRLQLLLTPSLYDKLQAAAEADEVSDGSVNKFVNRLLEKALK